MRERRLVASYTAGVSRVSATLVAASLLVTAWNIFAEYQRSVQWPPPV